MSNCYEKFEVGEGGAHGLEARATGAMGPCPLPLPLNSGAQASSLCVTGKMPVLQIHEVGRGVWGEGGGATSP
jgi:hypothetical protein